MARWFVVAGIILILVGAILHFAPGILNWFGTVSYTHLTLPTTPYV